MISIIIPVYNTEKYLGKCLDSILDSVYGDFEVILINDDSVDQSVQVCKEYCRKDNRIKLIEQKHKGVSEARNRGMEESRGEWIIFVDSDDEISSDFLRQVAEEEYQDQDMLIFDYMKQRDRSKKNEAGTLDRPTRTKQYGKEDKALLVEKLLNVSRLTKDGNTSLLPSWAKAYKKNIIEQYSIRFPSDIIIGEDRLFNIEYISHMKSCTYISQTVYFTRTRSDSAMHGFHLDYLKNDQLYQEKLAAVLEEYGIFSEVEAAYYNSVLSNMADVLVRGIFHLRSSRRYRENCELCRDMQKYEIYRKALKYNKKTGILPRRVLLFFFRTRCYLIVDLICKISYVILERMDRL